MDAILSMENIYRMLSSLSDSNKRWLADHLYADLEAKSAINSRALSDEELAQRLAAFPAWDESEHADLSAINYSAYKPYRSQTTTNAIAKWL